MFTVACSGEPPARVDTVVAATGSTVTARSADSTPAISSGTPPAPPPTVDEFGIGALRAGMTIPEAARMVGGSFAAPASGAESCTYAIWREAPPGVTVMLDKGVVARVDVARGSVIATSRGARIGDAEARIKELYKGRVVVTPHEYTDGHYLTVTPPPPRSGEDPSYRLVFETDGNRVTRYRSGQLPQVGWVESCN